MKIAVITNIPYEKCETFVKLQIDNLPFPITHLYGYKHPFIKDGTSIKNNRSKLSSFIYRIFENQIHEYQTYKTLKNEKIELVLAEYGTVGAYLTGVCKKLKIPLIVHFLGHDAVRKSVLEQHGEAYKKMFAYASRIISVSNVMSQKLIGLGCSPEKIVYNPCVPHDNFFEVNPHFTKKQLIAVGRFVEKKAPELLIRSFNKVLQYHPDTQLVIAGEGQLLAQCKQLTRELHIEENVIFLGIISPKTQRAYFSESQIFVQHSITASDGDMEGTPVAILEASAAGLPVVSTLHAGIPDVIIDGETGYLVKEKDIENMANRIIELLNDIPLAQKMGAAGKDRIKKHFTSQHYINKLTDSIINAVSLHETAKAQNPSN
jgi:colanic acid/amylovoran biosynthesis glycosyltransferase